MNPVYYRMEESPEKIYMAYRGLIKSLINSIVINNPGVVDSQDLQQAGAMAVISALQSYDPSLGSFPSYIRKCIRNALLEQANSFSNIFTTDERVRRQANSIIRLRSEGLNDEEIMVRLGIKTDATFHSLLGLINNYSLDLDQVELEDEISIDESSVHRILDDIGLTEIEIQFVDLSMQNQSMDYIATEMEISRSNLYNIKASIRDKILAWGQNN